MKVFVTGASGIIGSAVCEELARAGHEVVGLVRDPTRRRALEAREVATVVGAMQEPGAWIGAARDAHALVHCAAEMSPQFHALDRQTAAALLDAAAAARAPRLVVYTSGVWLYGDTRGRRADEGSPLDPPALSKPRAETEARVLAASAGDVRTLVLRPGCVYGGRGGLTAAWFEDASAGRPVRIVGDGSQRWTMVHREDLAVAYRLAVESPFAREVFNVTDRSRFTVRDCALAAGRAAGRAEVEAIPLERALEAYGKVAECLALSQHVGSGKAERWLGWTPKHAGFVDEVARLHLAWKASRAG